LKGCVDENQLLAILFLDIREGDHPNYQVSRVGPRGPVVSQFESKPTTGVRKSGVKRGSICLVRDISI
jgi:hypothetical protein